MNTDRWIDRLPGATDNIRIGRQTRATDRCKDRQTVDTDRWIDRHTVDTDK